MGLSTPAERATAAAFTVGAAAWLTKDMNPVMFDKDGNMKPWSLMNDGDANATPVPFWMLPATAAFVFGCLV